MPMDNFTTLEIKYSFFRPETKTWTKIGDVVGQPGQSTNGAAPDGGKIVYEGKEYDFVFDIVLDDRDEMKLKLPFNRGDDPWMAAQNFINKHELSQFTLDTIAKHIIKNAGKLILSGSNILIRVDMTLTVKGIGPSASVGGGVVDPFTGGGAYSSTGDSGPTAMDTSNGAGGPNTHFPQGEFLTFAQQPKFEALTKKIKEFNATVPEEIRVEEAKLDRINPAA